MTTKTAQTAKPKAKETTFRAHFRTDTDDKPQTMDVTTSGGIGEVNKAVYAKHRVGKVRVRIDKVKVLRE